MRLTLSDFDYNFPKQFIAYRPLERRDESRLLVIDRQSRGIRHTKFSDLAAYLKKGDAVVLNDTKVVPAALVGRLSNNAELSMLVLEKTAADTARCLAKPAKKFKINTKIFFSNNTTATVIEETPDKVLKFSCPIDALLKKEGKMPLPPYIKRESDKSDFESYQTVYAKNIGAVAAPTAGLHFTQYILKAIVKKGAKAAYLTLHVGYGTFRPVRCENITDHKMHSEWFNVPQETVDIISKTRNNGGRILAVGTTSCRVLETIAENLHPRPYTLDHMSGLTNLFIYPPYPFKLTDMLLTNFHLPKTTLLMLVSAFCGHDLMKEAYRQAIEKGYRLFSYGDAMLII